MAFQLRKNTKFTNTSCDQLVILAPKVQYNDLVKSLHVNISQDIHLIIKFLHVLSYIVLIVLSWVNRFSRTFFMNLIKF